MITLGVLKIGIKSLERNARFLLMDFWRYL